MNFAARKDSRSPSPVDFLKNNILNTHESTT